MSIQDTVLGFESIPSEHDSPPITTRPRPSPKYFIFSPSIKSASNFDLFILDSFIRTFSILTLPIRSMAASQLAERWLLTPKVQGSNPDLSQFLNFIRDERNEKELEIVS